MLCHFVVIPAVFSNPEFSHVIKGSDPLLPPLGHGRIQYAPDLFENLFPDAELDLDGALVQAFLDVSDEGPTRSTPVAVSFSESAALQWSVYFDPGSATGSEQNVIYQSLSESDTVFVVSQQDSGTLWFGEFDAPSLENKYAYEVDVGDLDNSTFSGLPSLDGNLTLKWEDGDDVRFLIVDGLGSPILDKRYSSSDFIDDTLDDDEEQSVVLLPKRGSDGFVFVADVVVGETFGPSSNISIVADLTASGEVVWSRKFVREGEYATISPAAPVSFVLDDGGVIFTSFDVIETDSALFGYATRFFKVSATGELEWAKTVDNALLLPYLLGALDGDNDVLWLNGTGNFTLEGSSKIVLGIDIETGATVAEVHLDPSEGSAYIIGETSESVYIATHNYDVSDAFKVYRFDRNLQNPTVFENNVGPDEFFMQVSGENRLIGSYLDQETGEMQIISYDGDLNPVVDESCIRFTTSTLGLIEKSLVSNDMPVTESSADLTVSDGATVLTPITLELHDYPLTVETCSGEPIGGEGGETPQSAPSSLAITVGESDVQLSWNDLSDDETGFEIERREQGDSQWDLVVTTAANVVSYTDSLNVGSLVYEYRIGSVNAAGGSAFTATVTAEKEAEGGEGGPGNDVDLDSELPVEVTLLSGNRIELVFQTRSGYRYDLHRSSDLVESFVLIDTLLGSGGSASFTLELPEAGSVFLKLFEVEEGE